MTRQSPIHRRPRPGRRRAGGALIAGALLVAAGTAAAATASAATVPRPAPGLAAGAASFGGSAVSSRVDVFYQQVNHRLTEFSSGGTQDLGGVLTSAPAAYAEQTPTEFVDEGVFARGGDHAIWGRQFSDGQGEWQPWFSLGGKALGAPSVSCFGTGSPTPVVYVRGTNGGLFRRPISGSWSSYGGRLLSDPAALAAYGGSCAGAEDVFGIGGDSAVWERTATAWHRIGGRSTATPAAIQLPGGEVDLFVRGTDNALSMTSRAAGSTTWAPWHRVGGQFSSPISAVVDTTAPAARVVLGLGTDGNLWRARNVIGSSTWSWSIVP